jgi:hypothetical protein
VANRRREADPRPRYRVEAPVEAPGALGQPALADGTLRNLGDDPDEVRSVAAAARARLGARATRHRDQHVPHVFHPARPAPPRATAVTKPSKPDDRSCTCLTLSVRTV